MRKTITATLVQRMRPPITGRLQVYDTVIPGFGLRITDRGVKTWFLMSRVPSGEQARFTLGRMPAVGLAAARKAARKKLEEIARGDDPRRLAEKEAARSRGTFGHVADDFLERAAAQTKTYDETKRIIEKELRPRWKARPLAQITRHDIVGLLDRIVDRGAPVMANRTLTVIKRIFAFAIDRSVVDASPCVKLKPPGGKERPRERVLDTDELVGLWNAFDPAALGMVFATFLRVVLLTAQRRSEVAGMRWDDLDLADGLWRMADTKAGRAHEVPLVPAVVDLLRAKPRHDGCAFVFTTNGKTPISGFSKLITSVSTTAEVTGWTIHDLRRTAASQMTALGVPADHVERVLGHVLPGMRRVYVRHEFLPEKRAALETWTDHVHRIVAEAEARGAA